MTPTPGPWVVRTDEFNTERREGICASVMDGQEDTYLAEVWDDFEWEVGDGPDTRAKGTGLANARLMAAAPELLAAAKHAVMEWRLHGQLTDSCRVLEAAIQKADGEPA